MEDIGDPLLCKLGCKVFFRCCKNLLVVKDAGFRPDWYVEYIEVHCHGKSFLFCVYEWIGEDFIVAEGCAQMPDKNQSELMTRFHENYLEQQQAKYRWCEPDDMPYKLTGHLEAKEYKELDQNIQWSIERDAEFNKQADLIKRHLALNKIAGLFRDIDKLDEVRKLLILPDLKNRDYLKPCWFQWKEDREFARQQLNGSRLVISLYET